MSFIINPYQFAAAAGFAFLLDDYPNAFIARSMARKLKSDYAGSAIRIRRSSDNTEQDIGFVDNLLDTGAITTFVGANSAYIVTAYDQSGNGFNWTQSTQSRQPRIVNAGTLETLGSKPVAFYDGSNDLMTVSGLIGKPSSTYSFSVIKLNKTPVGMYNNAGNGTGNAYWIIFDNGNAASPDQNSGTITYFKNGTSVTASRDALHDNFINVQALLTAKGVNMTTASWGTAIFDSYGDTFDVGYLQEDIIYDDQTNSQSGIENNIKTFYGL